MHGWATAPAAGVQQIFYKDPSVLTFSVHSAEDSSVNSPRAWVQCDSCGKWRTLPVGVPVPDVDKWFCRKRRSPPDTVKPALSDPNFIQESYAAHHESNDPQSVFVFAQLPLRICDG